MFRSMTSLVALLAAASLVAPAMAADADEWGTDFDFRDSFTTEPEDWAGLGDEDDPLSLEFGVRYYYSMGSQNFTTGAGSFTSSDASQIAEGHLRIEDDSTNTFAKALGGYAFSVQGEFEDPFDTGSVADGHVGYLGADLGWNAFGNNQIGAGALVGYMYWNDSPRTERSNYTTAESSDDVSFDQDTGQTFLPMDSSDNNLDIHMLRLGGQAQADFGFFDITAEAVAVPYAKVDGIVGNDQTSTVYDYSVYPGGNVYSIKASPTNVDGWGYGGMAELALGIHPVENLTFRIGGRAWYLQGTADVTYDQATIGNPTDSDAVNPPNFDTPPVFSKQTFIETAQPFSLFRYGVFAEATYAF